MDMNINDTEPRYVISVAARICVRKRPQRAVRAQTGQALTASRNRPSVRKTVVSSAKRRRLTRDRGEGSLSFVASGTHLRVGARRILWLFTVKHEPT